THYFELTTLAEQFANTVNIHLDAMEHQDKIVFLHQVQEGPASQSYGIQVAALAGVPPKVVETAKRHLLRLENQSVEQTQLDPTEAQVQFDMFVGPGLDPKQEKALARLEEINPDDMTPKMALEALYELKESLK
ncbi:MAG: DNA mismatch repair protein MutS, partial [Hydrogenovibrio sp.]|nr:DNA mismatch repair protein MutS [Hydrogenovibrio sp.]